MLTMTLLMIAVMIVLAITPWVGSTNAKKHELHPTDLMAGDEGEDDPGFLAYNR